MTYDFTTLPPDDFENLVAALLSREWGRRLESFKPGKDRGIDLRNTRVLDETATTIVQCQRYAPHKFAELNGWVRPRWETYRVREFEQPAARAAIEDWLKSLAVSQESQWLGAKDGALHCARPEPADLSWCGRVEEHCLWPEQRPGKPIVPTEHPTRIHADVFFGDWTDNC
jgi:Restriction endonuclease